MYNFNLFSDQFQKASFFERCAFKELSKFPQFDGWNIKFTSFMGMEPYDFIMYKPGSKPIVGEIKIRTHIRLDYMLEPRKITDIKSHIEDKLKWKEPYYKRLFINFTPERTYLWNMDITNSMTTSIQNCNRTTATYAGKVDKVKYDLPISKALKIEYIWNESDAISYYKRLFKIK